MGAKPEEEKVNGVIVKHWCYAVLYEQSYRDGDVIAGVFDEFKDAEKHAMRFVEGGNEYVSIYMIQRNAAYPKSAGHLVFAFQREHN